MTRKTYILYILLSVSLFSRGQQATETEEILQLPLIELLRQVNEKGEARFYFLPKDVADMVADLPDWTEPPLRIVQEALKKTQLKISEFQGNYFITKDMPLITSLPDGYFTQEKEYDDIDAELRNEYSFSLNRQELKATSENKVYEIGSSSENISGKVNLSGIITDFKTGEPVTGVTIFINEPLIGTSTDAFGYYTLQLPVGRHELNIRGMGMKDTKRQIHLHAEGKLNIELEEQVFALKEVTISSERKQNVRSTTIGMEHLKMKEIKNIPMVFGEVDIIRAILALPGVKAVGEASSGFNVRGGATDQNLILFNDGTIYNPTHLFGFFSAFNPDIVKDMELYKSSIPARYGGRISSVLDISTREGNRNEFKGSASIGLLTSRLTLEGPLFNNKTSYILGGRTTYSDWILNKLPEKSGYQDGSASFYDMNASINHRFSEHDNLYLTGYFSRDKFHFDEFERYSYRNANTAVKWRHIFSPRFTGVITGGYDHYDYKTISSDNPATAYDLSFGVDQYFGKLDFTWYLNDKHTLDFGGKFLFYDLNPGKYLPYSDESLVVEDRLQREKAHESALYVGDRWNITPALSLDLGVRYSLFQALGPRDYFLYDDTYLPSLPTATESVSESSGPFKTYQGPEFRVSARYEWDNDLSVKAGFNTMRQYIHKLSNTTIMAPTDTWKLTDANIRPQTGSQFAVGVYKNFANNTIETSIEGYYKTMDDYLDYRNGAELIMNHNIETDVLPTEGRAYGIEFMVKKTQGKLNGWVSYTYSRTELRQKDPRIPEPVNSGDWYPADYDKPHDFKFIGNYKFTHRYSLSLNCDYSTGRPITLPVSKYHFAGGEFVYYSERNKYRIPDFFRMDMSFNIEPSHHLTLLTHSTISLGVYNLTGRKNAYSVYYISENGLIKGYKLAIFGVPIPYIAYNIKF